MALQFPSDVEKFEFEFRFQEFPYRAECRAFPIDGSTELHVTPLDPDLFEGFGVRILSLAKDGSISAEVPPPAEERDYILAVASGLADYYSSEPSSTS